MVQDDAHYQRCEDLQKEARRWCNERLTSGAGTLLLSSLEEKHILRRFWILLFVTAAGSSCVSLSGVSLR